MPTGPVVSLAEVRAAKEPLAVTSVSVPVSEALDALAVRLYDEANQATRGLVIEVALQRLQPLLGDRPEQV
jgi:hypothetical protein